MSAQSDFEAASRKLKGIIDEATRAAVQEVRKAQRDVVAGLEKEIQTARDEFSQDREDFVKNMRARMKEQLDEGTARFEEKAAAMVTLIRKNADRARDAAKPSAGTEEKPRMQQGVFPQVPKMSVEQLNALKVQTFSAEQALQFLAEVVTKIPGTDDLVIPPEYLWYTLAKQAGIIR